MGFYRFFHNASSRVLIGFFLIASLFTSPAYSLDTKDSELFINGFNAYLKRDYQVAIDNLSGSLEKYPDSSLRDMTILWLSRSYLKAGNKKEAGRYMAQFLKEYPDNPLKSTVEEELLELATKAPQVDAPPGQQVAKAAPVSAAASPPVVGTPKNESASKTIPLLAQDETARLADEKLAEERVAAERSAQAKAVSARKEAEQIALERAESQRTLSAAAQQKEQDALQAKLLREQAITEYKAVLDRYPGSQAATSAKIRLKELGVAYQVAAAKTTPSSLVMDEKSTLLAVEVGQHVELELSLASEQQIVEVGKRFTMPFAVINRGNSPDSFTLESGFPGTYKFRFVAAAAPDLPVVKTPQLLPGEQFNGLMQLEMPAISMDGERKIFPVNAHSVADASSSQSRSIRLVAKAPVLRVVFKSDLPQISPGERIPYKLVLLNVGSAAARDVSLRVTFSPQYNPADFTAAGFTLEGNNVLVVSGLQLAPGESREMPLAMQLKDSALAREELFLHAEMINPLLNRTDTFISAPVTVKAVSGINILANAQIVTAVPGQTVTVLLTVTNTGNVRDDFVIKPLQAENLSHSFYLDTNRDGVKQASEPRVNHVGPLAPKEVANLILEITTTAAEKDGVSIPLTFTLDSQNDPSRKSSANLNIVYSRPVLNLTLAGKGGKIKPGEVNSFELSCVNAGSGMAKMVDVRSSLPAELELIASEPHVAGNNKGLYSWRFDQLGAGEKRTITVSYRVKQGTAVGTSLSLKNSLTYQDHIGNSY